MSRFSSGINFNYLEQHAALRNFPPDKWDRKEQLPAVLCSYEYTGYQRVNKLRHEFSVCSTEVMKMNPSGGVQRDVQLRMMSKPLCKV